ADAMVESSEASPAKAAFESLSGRWKSSVEYFSDDMFGCVRQHFIEYELTFDELYFQTIKGGFTRKVSTRISREGNSGLKLRECVAYLTGSERVPFKTEVVAGTTEVTFPSPGSS